MDLAKYVWLAVRFNVETTIFVTDDDFLSLLLKSDSSPKTGPCSIEASPSAANVLARFCEDKAYHIAIVSPESDAISHIKLQDLEVPSDRDMIVVWFSNNCAGLSDRAQEGTDVAVQIEHVAIEFEERTRPVPFNVSMASTIALYTIACKIGLL